MMRMCANCEHPESEHSAVTGGCSHVVQSELRSIQSNLTTVCPCAGWLDPMEEPTESIALERAAAHELRDLLLRIERANVAKAGLHRTMKAANEELKAADEDLASFDWPQYQDGASKKFYALPYEDSEGRACVAIRFREGFRFPRIVRIKTDAS